MDMRFGKTAKKRTLILTLASVLFMGTAAVSNAAVTEEEDGVKHDIVILATSDVHCGVDENFGYAGLEQIRETLEKNGDFTILVDCGDSIQGEGIGTITRGGAVIDLMNDLKYDAAVPGNHEFDYGMDRFLELAAKADFPYISCNFNREGDLVFSPYLIKEVNGTKIGFVGVTTPKTVTSSAPAAFQDENGRYVYGFMQEDGTGQKLYDAVREAVDNAWMEGADYVFLLSHLGGSQTCRPWTYDDVIRNTSGINAVLDGHSHDTDQVIGTDKDGSDVPRMGLGTKMNGIGCVRISAEDGSVAHELYTWTNIPALPDLTGIENRMTVSVDGKMEELRKEMDRVVASSPFDLYINDPEVVDKEGVHVRIVRREETNLGDLLADAFLSASGADAALINGGGIRAGIDAGNITYGDLMKVQPNGNEMYVIEATGQQILDALEWGARVVPDENGGFMQAAGLTYEIHTDIKPSCIKDENGMFAGVGGAYRVQNVMIGKEALDPGKTYTLASNNFILLEHGSGFTMFDGCKVLQEGTQLDNQLLIRYLTETLGGIIPDRYADPHGQGRITIK